ncbi:MAG: hypothetical protein HUK05_03335 [Prevotella sp.]|nr:hypothetical protein [Prevotella sp.]
MQKTIALFTLLCTAILGYAQENKSADKQGITFHLSGIVRDRLTSSQLMYADVMMYDMNDTLVATGKAHDWKWDDSRDAEVESARFTLKFTKRKGKFRLKIAAEEHDTLVHDFSLDNVGKREIERDLGVFYLTKATSKQLDEVTVTATKVKFYHRGDTIVYNADAFQLAEGSMLDALIEQLPGVQLKEGGEIYVNGKKVESLLLNGKDFFRGNNQLMLDNLGAYTVKNIEVYKKQTERAKFLDLTDEGNKELTMDVKLKKEYIGGWTGNVEAGAGTENRYLGRLFAMHFNAKSQYTLIGNMNNLNNSTRPTNSDSWEPELRPNGTKQYKQLAANYSTENDESTKKASGDIDITINRNLYEAETNTTNFLQTMNTQSHSLSNILGRSFALNTNHSLQWQNKWLMLKLNPQFQYEHGTNEGSSESTTKNYSETPNANETLITETLNTKSDYSQLSKGDVYNAAKDNGSSDEISASGKLQATIKIPKTSDAVDFYADFNHNSKHTESFERNIIHYGDEAMSSIGRNSQTVNRPDYRNSGAFGTSYLLKYDKFTLNIKYAYNFSHSSLNSAYYLGQIVSEHKGDYTMENLQSVNRVFDPSNSNTSVENNNNHAIHAALSRKINKYWDLNLSGQFAAINNTLHYEQNSKIYEAAFKETKLNEAVLGVSYGRSTETLYKSFHLGYNLYHTLPTLRNMIAVEDTRNPLTEYLANPNLKSQYTHWINVNWSIYNTEKDNSISGYAIWYCVNNNFVNGYTYNTTSGKHTYQTYNVSGNWELQCCLRGDFTPIKNFSLTPRFYYEHQRRHSMIGENTLLPTRYAMNTDIYNATLKMSFRPHEKLSLYLNSSIRWQNSNGQNPSAQNINFCEQNYSFNVKWSLPWNFSFHPTLLLFNRSGMQDEKMNKTEWILNGRITKSFGKGKWLASITAFDLLHQIKSVEYYVTADARIETFTNTISRYILLHLQYKFNIKPKKKIAESVRYF